LKDWNTDSSESWKGGKETRVNKLGITIALAVIVAVLIFSLFGVALAADPTADASRTIDPQVVERGEDVEVTVEFTNVLNVSKSFALLEDYPEGWTFTRGTDDAPVFRSGPPPEWVWLLMWSVGPGETKTVTYTLTVPMDAEAGNYTIEGIVTGAEVENPVGGDNTITVRVLHDLTTSSTAGGVVTDPGMGTYTYDEGTVVDLVATPSVGYRFDEWTGDVGDVADVHAATTTITMNGDYSVTAEFVKTYDLTTSSTAGGVVTNPGMGTYTYDEGTVVDLVATPNAGYRFDEWTGDVSAVADVNDPTTTITMNGDYSVAAEFVKTYDLTTSSTAGGVVTDPGMGTYAYDEGTVVDLVATPNAGYRFDEWTGDVSTIADANDPTTTITMNGDYSITANFCELSTYQFIYDVPEHIVACEDAEMTVTFQTNVLGYCGYGNVRYKFYADGPGDVTFKVTDPEEGEHIFVNSGYWELAVGLDLPADYSETNNWTLHFSTPGEPGGYTVTFSLVNATSDEIIAGLTEPQALTVEAGDILQYYRSLHEPIDVVTTLDLLAAADDWIADVAMPCFGDPITTAQLLELAEEWIAAG